MARKFLSKLFRPMPKRMGPDDVKRVLRERGMKQTDIDAFIRYVGSEVAAGKTKETIGVNTGAGRLEFFPKKGNWKPDRPVAPEPEGLKFPRKVATSVRKGPTKKPAITLNPNWQEEDLSQVLVAARRALEGSGASPEVVQEMYERVTRQQPEDKKATEAAIALVKRYVDVKGVDAKTGPVYNVKTVKRREDVDKLTKRPERFDEEPHLVRHEKPKRPRAIPAASRPDPIPVEGVTLGTEVTLEPTDPDTDKKSKRIKRVLARPEEAEQDPEKLSIEAPVGKAILGADKGETVEVETPKGVMPYKVVKAPGIVKPPPKEKKPSLREKAGKAALVAGDVAASAAGVPAPSDIVGTTPAKVKRKAMPAAGRKRNPEVDKLIAKVETHRRKQGDEDAIIEHMKARIEKASQGHDLKAAQEVAREYMPVPVRKSKKGTVNRIDLGETFYMEVIDQPGVFKTEKGRMYPLKVVDPQEQTPLARKGRLSKDRFNFLLGRKAGDVVTSYPRNVDTGEPVVSDQHMMRYRIVHVGTENRPEEAISAYERDKTRRDLGKTQRRIMRERRKRQREYEQQDLAEKIGPEAAATVEAPIEEPAPVERVVEDVEGKEREAVAAREGFGQEPDYAYEGDVGEREDVPVSQPEEPIRPLVTPEGDLPPTPAPSEEPIRPLVEPDEDSPPKRQMATEGLRPRGRQDIIDPPAKEFIPPEGGGSASTAELAAEVTELPMPPIVTGIGDAIANSSSMEESAGTAKKQGGWTTPSRTLKRNMPQDRPKPLKPVTPKPKRKPRPKRKPVAQPERDTRTTERQRKDKDGGQLRQKDLDNILGI